MKIRFIYLYLFIILTFAFNINSSALTYGGCEYSDISRLKSFVSNINFSYDYYIENNRAYFNITISNMVPGMYFIDSATDKKYTYNDTVEGEITLTGYSYNNGTYKFYSELSECYGVKLGNRYYNFPAYNIYYNDPLCRQNKNYSLCQKWTKVSYSYQEFKKLIDKYNEAVEIEDNNENLEIVYERTYLDIIVQFYVKYYYFILIGIILICITIMIISKKKNSFDL